MCVCVFASVCVCVVSAACISRGCACVCVCACVSACACACERERDRVCVCVCVCVCVFGVARFACIAFMMYLYLCDIRDVRNPAPTSCTGTCLGSRQWKCKSRHVVIPACSAPSSPSSLHLHSDDGIAGSCEDAGGGGGSWCFGGSGGGGRGLKSSREVSVVMPEDRRFALISSATVCGGEMCVTMPFGRCTG